MSASRRIRCIQNGAHFGCLPDFQRFRYYVHICSYTFMPLELVAFVGFTVLSDQGQCSSSHGGRIPALHHRVDGTAGASQALLQKSLERQAPVMAAPPVQRRRQAVQ